MADHLAGGPTGPPGKCQAARRPSQPLLSSITIDRVNNKSKASYSQLHDIIIINIIRFIY